MQQERRILGPVTVRDDAMPTSDAALIEQAIARRLCVSAIYNRVPILLAPHILYTKHGDLFVDAVVTERDGKLPKEIKLGTFKIAGLTVLAASLRSFVPEALFDRKVEKYAGNTVIAVSRLGAARFG